jgi:hypothetical protein
VPGVGTFQATLINAGIPTIFLNARDIGYTGTELQGDINEDKAALARFETIRAWGAVKMGLIKDAAATAKRQHTPKVAFVAPPKDYVASSGKAIKAGGCGSDGARPVDGKAAPRHDGHGGCGHRHGGSCSRNAGQPGRRWRRAKRGSLRPRYAWVPRPNKTTGNGRSPRHL